MRMSAFLVSTMPPAPSMAELSSASAGAERQDARGQGERNPLHVKSPKDRDRNLATPVLFRERMAEL